MKENLVFGIFLIFIAALFVVGAFAADWVTGSFIK